MERPRSAGGALVLRGARGAVWSPVRAGVSRLEWARSSMPEAVC